MKPMKIKNQSERNNIDIYQAIIHIGSVTFVQIMLWKKTALKIPLAQKRHLDGIKFDES